MIKIMIHWPVRIQAVGRVVRSNALGHTNLEKKAIKREKPIKIDDFGGTPIYGKPHIESWM